MGVAGADIGKKLLGRLFGAGKSHVHDEQTTFKFSNGVTAFQNQQRIIRVVMIFVSVRRQRNEKGQNDEKGRFHENSLVKGLDGVVYCNFVAFARSLC